MAEEQFSLIELESDKTVSVKNLNCFLNAFVIDLSTIRATLGILVFLNFSFSFLIIDLKFYCTSSI